MDQHQLKVVYVQDVNILTGEFIKAIVSVLIQKTLSRCSLQMCGQRHLLQMCSCSMLWRFSLKMDLLVDTSKRISQVQDLKPHPPGGRSPSRSGTSTPAGTGQTGPTSWILGQNWAEQNHRNEEEVRGHDGIVYWITCEVELRRSGSTVCSRYRYSRTQQSHSQPQSRTQHQGAPALTTYVPPHQGVLLRVSSCERQTRLERAEMKSS